MPFGWSKGMSVQRQAMNVGGDDVGFLLWKLCMISRHWGLWRRVPLWTWLKIRLG